jgi:hypothetical protein
VIRHYVFDSGTEPLDRHAALGSRARDAFGGVRARHVAGRDRMRRRPRTRRHRSAVRKTLRPTSVSRRAGTHRPTSEAGQRPGERGVRQSTGTPSAARSYASPTCPNRGRSPVATRRRARHGVQNARHLGRWDPRLGSFSDSSRPTLRLALLVERSQARHLRRCLARTSSVGGRQREWDPVSEVPTAAVVC